MNEILEGNFPIIFNIIEIYQYQYTDLTDNLKFIKYKRGYFLGVLNIYINLITFKVKFCIPSKIQIFVVTWYHMYLINTVKYESNYFPKFVLDWHLERCSEINHKY